MAIIQLAFSLDAPQTKQCGKCHMMKPLDAFHRNKARADGYELYCKQCRSHRGPEGYVQHIERRAAGLKRCTKCGETKPLSEFGKQASQPDGHHPRCKACKKIVGAEDYAAHREERSARQRAFNAAHREERRAARKAYYHANRAAGIAAAVEWGRANPDKRRQYGAKWEREHPDQRREYVRRRYARRKAGRVAPFTLAQLQEKMAYWYHRCWMCGEPADTIDHVKPLAKGGLDVLANLRPACSHCNSSKRDRWPYPLIRNIPRWQ